MSNSGSSNPLVDQNSSAIATLFIRPSVGKLNYDEIIGYFSVFGDVNSVRIRNKPKYSYGFVKFSLEESAAKALGVDVHVIAGRKVKVAVPDDRYKNLTTIMDLNDDCISEILSMQCLSARDLCSAAETCRRLKRIASRAFKREYKNCDLDFLSKGISEEELSMYEWDEYTYPYSTKRSSKTAKRILMNFGSVVRNLHIGGVGDRECGEWSRKVLTYANEYCSNKSLYIWNAVKSSMLPLIADCKRLETLVLGIPDGSTLDFTNLGHLKKLEIACLSENVSKKALGLANLNFLEHLMLCSQEVFVDSEDIRTLSQLQRLQTLELIYPTELQNWNQLGDLVQLTTLKINSNEQVDLDFVLLVKRLSKLTYLAARFKMENETYLRLVDVVVRRPDKTKLTFELASCNFDYDDLESDLRRNAHIVEITQLS